MILFRFDAIHPAGDGAFCQFFRDELQPAVVAGVLLKNGWETDVYPEDVGPITEDQVQHLERGTWPLVPTSTVLEWQAAPAAGDDPDEVFEVRRGQ